MTISIIGCGDSAKHWDGSGYSIGVNDAFKFGHKINTLVVVNHASKFSNEHTRMKTITESKPDEFICHSSSWRQWFPDAKIIRLVDFYKKVKKGVVYHTRTSPFVACSLAYNMGATEIVLWGVDMETHSSYRSGMRYFQTEVDAFLRFFDLISNETKVYVGADGSVFCKYLPKWKNSL